MPRRIPLPKNRIKELREQRGWSHAKLGARCIPVMTGTQIWKREDGITAVTIEDMQRIAAALEVHPADLLPLPPYSQQERALLGTLRELAEPDRAVVFRVADAFRASEAERAVEPPTDGRPPLRIDGAKKGRR